MDLINPSKRQTQVNNNNNMNTLNMDINMGYSTRLIVLVQRMFYAVDLTSSPIAPART